MATRLFPFALAALLAATLLAAGPATRAQAQPVTVAGSGVRAGVSLAQVRGGAFSGPQLGAAASVFGRVALGSSGFSLQPELRYVRKGGGGQQDAIEDEFPLGTFAPTGAVTVRVDDASARGHARVDLVEVPLLVRYAVVRATRLPLGQGRSGNADRSNALGVSVYAGPYAALGLRRTAEAEVKGQFTVRSETLGEVLTQNIDDFRTLGDLIDEANDQARFFPAADVPTLENPLDEGGDLFERLDYGLTVGADLGFSFAGERLVLGLRYDLGLRDLLRQENESVQAVQQFLGSIDDFSGLGGFEGKTSTLTVELGVAF